MDSRVRVRGGVLLFGVSVALLAFGAQGAVAAPKKITGKLTKPNLTVIALGKSGRAATATAEPKFKLTPRNRKVTLHLRAADGTYDGPVVVGQERKGRRAVVGVKAGSRLGEVRVKSAKGYAKPKEPLAEKWVDQKRQARAKRGIPIGAGVFGLVAARASGTAGPGHDLDLDGLPGALDVDDDGDLVLDNVDASPGGVAARTAGVSEGSSEFGIGTVLDVGIDATANASAGSTVEEIDAAQPDWGWMSIGIAGGSAELDCGGSADPANPSGWSGGLIYCTRGGTGRTLALPAFQGPDGPEHPAFPECCDSDGDGYGALLGGPNSTSEMSLQHRATTAQLGTGDVLIQHVSSGGSESECPPPAGSSSDSCASFASTIPFTFATVPALVSYSDTAGNSASVSYPVGGPANPTNPTPGPGAQGNGLPVAAGPSGEVILTLTFWRPQRKSIGTEQGQWTDIGGLRHSADIRLPDGSPPGGGDADCPQSAYLEASPRDEELAPSAPSPFTSATGFTDLAPDRPASVGETFTYRLNVTDCLRGAAWSAGEELDFGFQATDEPPVVAHTEQRVWFKRQ